MARPHSRRILRESLHGHVVLGPSNSVLADCEAASFSVQLTDFNVDHNDLRYLAGGRKNSRSTRCRFDVHVSCIKRDALGFLFKAV